MSIAYRVQLLLILITIVASTIRKDTSDFVTVPGGKQFHKDCVHHIPSNSFNLYKNPITRETTIVTSEGEEYEFLPCQYSPKPFHGPAWKAWTQYQNKNKVTRLYGEWTVPSAPPSSVGQILYYWNGIEPDDNSAVLQPVLQYGSTPAGGGNYWAIASWYVSDTDAYNTNILDVKPGDKITGNNVQLHNGTWIITGGKKGSSQTVQLLSNPPSQDYTWAYQVLEAYSVTSCLTQYPKEGKLVFDNITVDVAGSPVTPTWETMTKDPTCHESAGVVDPTQVYIAWN